MTKLATTTDQDVGSNSTVYLRNAWYVGSMSSEIGRQLKPLKMLGEPIVLFRDRRGQPIALEDACPHRKLPLSKGRIKGDHVECGYHGLTFDGSGACVRAPTQAQIPPLARVLSYPAVDKYGLVWVWMGNPSAADEAALIEIENADDPGWHLTQGDALSCKCNYLYLVDNLLDPSHVSWVHPTSFASSGMQDTPLDREERTNRLVVRRWIADVEVPPYYTGLVKFKGRCDRLQHYEARYPSIAINRSIFVPSGQGGEKWRDAEHPYVMVSYHFITPIDENNTRYHWLQQRNTDPDDASVTEAIARGAIKAFEEDREVLEAVHEGIANERTRHINLVLDAGAIRFRTTLGRKIASERHGRAGPDGVG